jgi:glycosyltransferase involved in cell wall biosynthesis
MRPKILMISSVAGIPRVHRIANTYALKYNVMILEWDRESKLSKYEYRDRVEIHRFVFKAPYGLKLIFKLPIWTMYLIIFCLTNKFGVIIPQNLDNLMPIWGIAKLKNVKIIYDIADFYSDAYIPKKAIILRQIVAITERFLIKRVDAIIIADDSRFVQLGNVDRKNVIAVYNTPHDGYESLSQNAIFNNSGISEFINGNFVIFYGGMIASDRGLNQLVDAVNGIPDVRLVVAGYGPMQHEFERYIKDKSNILYLGKVEYIKILELTYLSNCVVILYDPTILPNFIYSSPNKMFEAMMCGKPIIAIKGTSMAQILIEENCGLVINSINVDELRLAIFKLKNNPTLAINLGNNARNAYKYKYNWAIMENRLSNVIKLLLLC